MKNIIMIATIGRNMVFEYHGCVHQAYSDHFRAISDSCWIFIAKELYDLLPEKSPPFPCRKTWVIGTDVKIENDALNVLAAETIEDALQLVTDVSQRIVLMANRTIYDTVIEKHCEKVLCIEVVTIDKDVESTETFKDPPPLRWQPVITKSGSAEGKHVPAFTIRKYKYEEMAL